jgi:hypothetical protein
MISKKCTKCKEVIPMEGFNNNKGTKDGKASQCRECMRSFLKEYRKSPAHVKRAAEYKKNRYNKERHPLGYTAVYYLPEEHYVGMTLNVRHRMSSHKSAGRLIQGYEVLAWFERSVDAHLFETQLHVLGYLGYFNGTHKPY